jgi:alkanesulfonate monooxygenase SsuD/methylene tetrahydromethanopterin reductase-like flavin-dependent oxidoreductase (luciferase family)
VNLVFADRDVEDTVRRRMGGAALRYFGQWSATGEAATAGTLAGSVAAVTQMTGEYVEAGADWIILRLMAPFYLDELTMFAEQVMPVFARDSASGYAESR